jgi:hypothetical protein
MQSSNILAMMVCTVAMVTAASTARADAWCNAGIRDSTPAERATMTAVLQAAKNALPPAPTGWVIVGDDQISVTSNICRDYEAAPWDYGFNRQYQRVDDQEARNKIIADAAAASAAAQKLKQPRLDAAMARMNKLVEKQVALIEKGDLAGAGAMNEEMAKLQDDYKKILDEGDSQEQLEASLAKASRDQIMYISVGVNSNQVTPDASAKPIPLPPGARAAFRWSTTQSKVTEDHALVLLGQWQSSTDGGWKRVRHANMPPTAAQVISIGVTADPDRIAGIIASINVKSLAAKVPN